MKGIKIAAVVLLLAGTLVPVGCLMNIVPSGFEFLGRREVDFGLDRDTIVISRGAGLLRQLLIIAKINPVEVWNVRVIFENGRIQDNDVRETLFVDRDRLFIDLRGDVRRVREVIFRYRKLTNAARRAVVELWGR